MQTPKVSIIILTYNQDEFIERAIKSALNQTYENFEIIISNNGSTDNTVKIIESFLPNKKIIFQNYLTNESPNLRQNQAIDISTGQLISWLYGDDYYLPNKIEIQVNSFDSLDQSYGVVYGPGFSEDALTNKKILSSSLSYSGFCLDIFLIKWLKEGNINPISPLVRRSCYDKFRPDNSIFTEGEVLYLHLAISYKFFYVDQPLVVMTDHESNFGKQIERNLSTHEKSILRLIKENNLSKKTQKLAYYHLAERKIIDSWHCFRSNKNIAWGQINLKEAFNISRMGCMQNKYFFLSLLTLFLPTKIRYMINFLLPRRSF